MPRGIAVAIRILSVVLYIGLAVHAHAQSSFYQGKTIKLVLGAEPGGSGDTRTRIIASFLRKYIPGNPTIISEFMPGGGSRKAANYLFNVARPDGLTIGSVSSGVVTSAILGETGVQYDIDKFHFLGATDSTFHYVFFVRKDLGLGNIEKLRAYSGLRLGAVSIGHTGYTYSRTFAWLLGLKDPKFVLGYSSLEIDGAIVRGEVDARSNNTTEIVRRNLGVPKEDSPIDFISILKIPREDKEPNFEHLPELDNFAKSDKERRFLALARATRSVGTPYLIPPGTPKELVQILRNAMKKTFQDPEFHKESKKVTGEEPTPLMPEAQEDLIRAVPRDAETVELFKLVNGNKPLPPR
jgi:tripartite-type tricarboxylate transporter receptor subunit TctC